MIISCVLECYLCAVCGRWLGPNVVDRHCFVPQMIVKYNATCSRWRTSRSELPYLEPHLTTGFGEDGRITDGGNDSDDGRCSTGDGPDGATDGDGELHTNVYCKITGGSSSSSSRMGGYLGNRQRQSRTSKGTCTSGGITLYVNVYVSQD